MHKGLNQLVICIQNVWQRTSYFLGWRWNDNIKGLEVTLVSIGHLTQDKGTGENLCYLYLPHFIN